MADSNKNLQQGALASRRKFLKTVVQQVLWRVQVWPWVGNAWAEESRKPETVSKM